MAKAALNTRNWKAWQDLQPPVGSTVKLTVTGEVEITNTNQTPHLAEHVPQGFNESILLLSFTISTSGAGNTVVEWRKVAPFKKDIREGQYTSVDILWEGESIGSANVESVV